MRADAWPDTPWKTVHVLHVSKAGGSAIGEALSALDPTYAIHTHDHSTRLHDVAENDGVLFFVREPVGRFVSAFNTRLRRGRPRNDARLRPDEIRAFELFGTPNELAEALSADDGERAARAREAMHAIIHVNRTTLSWFDSIEYVESRRSSVVLLGLQRFLNSDFEYVKRRLALPAALALPTDPIRTHATPPGFAIELSPVGRANIAAWYADDVVFYHAYQRLRAQWFGLETDDV